jgi:hypothetical protein
MPANGHAAGVPWRPVLKQVPPWRSRKLAAAFGRVGVRRGGCRLNISVAAPRSESPELRVQSLQLNAGVGGFVLLVCLGVVLVAVVLPCVDFVGEDLLVGDAAIQTLRREHAEFGFGHVEPTAVLGSVVPLCAAENYGGRSNDLTT